MRRMNYDRFANPTNFGEWDNENDKFVLDKPIEEGVYYLTIQDEAVEGLSAGIITINNDWYCASTTLWDTGADGKFIVVYLDGNVSLSTDSSKPTQCIIKLYKLD